ncbi:HupE/UreJ family protein [Gemmatimonas groenlandica]|uniref:HupE/UreJ family protein n=1 Tax=Gemmatimonas groenlandica TaxID=2732249 RepID=A0A6M4IVP2_9BACT|nr:HupE/UreJ family protein [Gemmatimonas groenlandica]QJR36251.1 HupE/UreJ family protein [Gemmatimonas groenlandica]
MSARRMLVALSVALTTFAAPLHAHLMPAQSGTLNVRGRAVFGALSIPVSTLTGFDDDGNGRLSPIELQRHDAALQQQISSRLQLTNGTDRGSRDFLQLSVELVENDPASAGGGTHVLVLVKQTFIAAPAQLAIHTDLFGSTGSEQQLAIKAMHDSTAEMAVLRASHPNHQFFQSPAHVATQYSALGIEHILTGVDHVLFVLTIIVAAAGWRYWLTVLTSFTVAHSITLALGMLNVVRISPSIVEPLILASIVLMFALNITHKATKLPVRAAIVFACGLLHGLGFASAMADIGLSGSSKLISLTAFNAGIELGQAAIVAVALLAIFAAKAHRPKPVPPFTLSAVDS